MLPHTQLCKGEDLEPEGDTQGLGGDRMVEDDNDMESCENLSVGNDNEQQ